ncbi:hypothetical protein AOQ84DRAFT_286339 [Glonium stellatum]|uniref:Zn(2)-C6 fungal-type domain-containing protein n=1 Tax=Glonium stellatum TaxID=574774 RepID=A0A8E2JW67_9PEZI|nr:hypothetical protein AOQ84DRAFT_286339 [Glonium stellatum]
MAVGVDHRLKKASKIDHRPPLRPHLSNGMSYDSLGLPSGIGVPVSDAVPASTFVERQDHALVGQTNAPINHSQPNKKRRPSKGKVPEIRRSVSTPHMRNLALANSGELSPTADKRRNKLGYHRTSVACGHCRRRKIRCLLSQDDPQGRCSNCIRLKKECNFYPVEQTNPPDQRPQATPKMEAGVGAPSASTPSSPRASVTSASEHVEEYRPYGAMSSASTGARFGMQSELEVDPSHTPHTNKLTSQHPPFAYAHQIENQWASSGFLPQSSVAEEPASAVAGYWRPSPSAAPSAYGNDSNLSGGQTPVTMSSTSNMSYGAHHDGQGWVQPTRSMSYGNIEGLPQQFPGQHLGTQHDYRGRNSPYHYPPSIETSAGPMHASGASESSSGPLSAPIVTQALHNYSYPPAWNPYVMHGQTSDVSSQGRSVTGPWYAEPTALGQVEEETVPPMQYQGLPNYYSGP